MFNLVLDTDNDAFGRKPAHEVIRILKNIVRRLENGDTDGKIMDTNGNSVGSWELSD